MVTNPILDKLNQLKTFFVGAKADNNDIAQIEAWTQEAKRKLILSSLAGHDGIKYITEIFESEIKSIDSSLLKSDSKILPDKERDRMLDKKSLAQKYLDLFSNLEEDLARLEEAVDNELDSNNIN